MTRLDDADATGQVMNEQTRHLSRLERALIEQGIAVTVDEYAPRGFLGPQGRWLFGLTVGTLRVQAEERAVSGSWYFVDTTSGRCLADVDDIPRVLAAIRERA